MTHWRAQIIGVSADHRRSIQGVASSSIYSVCCINECEARSPRINDPSKMETLYIVIPCYTMVYPLVNCYITMERSTIEIVDFSMKNGGSFHSYVSLPEGTMFYYQDYWWLLGIIHSYTTWVIGDYELSHNERDINHMMALLRGKIWENYPILRQTNIWICLKMIYHAKASMSIFNQIGFVSTQSIPENNCWIVKTSLFHGNITIIQYGSRTTE